MFSIWKDTWYFSRVCVRAKELFGTDLRFADTASGGKVKEMSNIARRNNFTDHEAAASCSIISIISLCKTYGYRGKGDEFRSMLAIEVKTKMLYEEGLIRSPVYNKLQESIDGFYSVCPDETQ